MVGKNRYSILLSALWLLGLAAGSWGAGPVLAQEQVLVSVFVRETCGHCREEEAFLEMVQRERPYLKVRYYDIIEAENERMFREVTDRFGLAKGTPITLVRGQLLVGFGTAETTGQVMLALIDGEGTANATFEDLLAGEEVTAVEEGEPQTSLVVDIPVVGKVVDVGHLSLAALSLVLGLVDGFNPCAIWVLVMFVVLLSQVGNRRRMWQYAGLFILAQAIMYYLILNVWYTVWDFVALDRIVTPLVGLLALGGGIYFLYRCVTFAPVCEVASPEQQRAVEKKARRLVGKPLTLAVALGIIGLALSVNVFEFACSVGIPQAFTKVLEINQLSLLGTQWFIGLYMLTYMLDDILVFGLALYSFEKIGLTHRYSRWTALVGGVLMIVLGIIMLFKPELLVV